MPTGRRFFADTATHGLRMRAHLLLQARIMRIHLLLFLSVACATPSSPPTRPSTSRGLRAADHLGAAREHDARAAELARWPERQRDPAGFEDPASGLWYRAFDTVRNEELLAAAHRTEAARLQAEYDEACAGIPSGEIAISPLQRHGLGGFPTQDGVIVVLAKEAGPGPRLLAAIRCHRAWMMLADAGMDDCPLDLRGIKIQTYGDETGISVEITVNNRALVRELQRRAAIDLERAAQLRQTQGTR